MLIEKQCLVCGNKILVKPSLLKRKKYCSRECANRGQSLNPALPRLVEKTCAVCKKVFRVTQSVAPKVVCCSDECSAKSRSNHPDSVWVTLECVQCGKSYTKRHYRVREGQKHFCSYACHWEWQHRQFDKHHIKLNCQMCGKEFLRSRYFVEVRTNSRFCSRKCLYRYNSLNRRREKNVNWKGGGKNDYGPDWTWQRKQARKRDKNKCILCGAEPHKWKLDVHHIAPFRTFGYIPGENDNHVLANKLENLVTLCKRCHRKVERNPELLKQK